jgi:hypothetical protein
MIIAVDLCLDIHIEEFLLMELQLRGANGCCTSCINCCYANTDSKPST